MSLSPLQLARSAPPATARRPSRVALYDTLEPAVRVLTREKNYTMRRALDWLEEQGALKPRDEADRCRIYRALCYRVNGRRSRAARNHQ